jgi:HPt (histidine-containing phosphotransfer) domain-containing protein
VCSSDLPIDLAKLDGILAQWLPRDKCHRVSPSEALKAGAPEQKGPSPALVLLGSMGVNIEKGMTLTGGAEREYRKVLAAFYRDLMERRKLFQEFSEAAGQGSFSPELLNLFTVSVHALKSASGTIGAEDVSREAAELEAAGRAGDLAAIAERLPPFRRHLDDLTDTLRIALGMDRGSAQAESGVSAAEIETFRPLFEALRTALEDERISEIDRALSAFEERPLSPEVAKRVADISDQVLISNFEEALEAVRDFLA